MIGMSKGKRNEREAANLYERAGYETFRPQESKFGETDMFGLGDILAVHPDRQPVFAQVKTNGPDGYKNWFGDCAKLLPPCFETHYAIKYDYEGWRLLVDRPVGNGYVEAVDEREISDIGPNHHSERSFGDGVVDFLRGKGVVVG